MIIVPDEPLPASSDEGMRVEVVKVFDGDGFLARAWHPKRQGWADRIPFRFAFIDAPEMAQPFGPESRNHLARLIDGKALRLDLIGKEAAGYLPIDPYKRILCMAFLQEQLGAGTVEYYVNGEHAKGDAKKPRLITRNIELEMIINGWAWVIQQYEFDRKEEYFAAQDNARRNRRGLWAMDNPEPPWKFKRRQRRLSQRAAGQGRLL